MKTTRISNIAILLSGGVDSSVALALLNLWREMGVRIVAFYIKVWMQDEFSSLGKCPWEEDIEYIKQVSKQLEIPFQIISLQKEYWESVVETVIEEIKQGYTPNPDIYCNSKIKFGKFLEQIGDNYEKIASGHYARLIEEEGTITLKTSADPLKDQTYFLSYLKKAQLSRCLFPLGGLSNLDSLPSWEKLIDFKSLGINYQVVKQSGFNKKQVRQLSRFFDLPTQNRKDSQGICFLGKIRFRDFLRYHLGERKGKIINWKNKQIVGEHLGYWYYTIGQRQGLGLSGGPWYVIKKDILDNIIYIAHYPLEVLEIDYFGKFDVVEINWLKQPQPFIDCEIKIRHGIHRYRAQIWRGVKDNHYRVNLFGRDSGIASGQFAVFYQQDVCLGSGMIRLVG
jgi:tRNA-specific 2-thiouridylase